MSEIDLVDRLQALINKGLSEDEILHALAIALERIRTNTNDDEAADMLGSRISQLEGLACEWQRDIEERTNEW